MSTRNLTDADVEAIAKAFHAQHICRFQNVSPDDMMFVKDLLSLYKETRSEVIKWFVRGIIYGALILIGIAGYFKVKGVR